MRSRLNQWLSHRAILLLSGGFGLLIPVAELRGQNLFDPYQPDSSGYNTSSFPTLPNNLALPGQARDASEYFRGPAVSRYNTFERYVNGDEGLGAGTRGGIGVPYFENARPIERGFQREFAPSASADRKYLAYEAERERLYKVAMKEKDPAKRTKLLREVARLRSPRESASRNSLPSKASTARSSGARSGAPSNARTSGSSRREALAGEALATPRALDSANSANSRIPATTVPRSRASAAETNDPADARRIRRMQIPDRRPRPPSEIPTDPAPRTAR